ncbi:MAG: hypothetical protein WC459_01720 [Patescibacteria group bacterium]
MAKRNWHKKCWYIKKAGGKKAHRIKLSWDPFDPDVRGDVFMTLCGIYIGDADISPSKHGWKCLGDAPNTHKCKKCEKKLAKKAEASDS